MKPFKAVIISMNALAMTSKSECTIERISEDKVQYKPKGKRKSYLLRRSDIGFIFKSNHLMVDSEGDVIRGNALWNFYRPGDYSEEALKEIRSYLEDKSNYVEGFYPSDKILSNTTYCWDGSTNDENAVLVFPEMDSRHAVAQRLNNLKFK